MDPDERVTALKKAYADIILNTAKESAARVMVSERKAQRFEHELKAAKEEGLRMLLRLKQMMDAKIREADLTASSQKKKIEELEAQLHEAEDIVRDLREELREVQSELERVKAEKAQHLNDQNIPTQGLSEINRLYTSQSIEFQPSMPYNGAIFTHAARHAFHAAHNCYSSSIFRGYTYNGSPDLPSIILRSKEPGLYRNGCTQRIRACERNPLDQEISSSASKIKTKGEKSVKEEKGSKVICKAKNQEKKSRKTLKKKVIQGKWLLDWSSIKKKKRAVTYRKRRSPSLRTIPGEPFGIDQPLSCLTPNLISASDDAHSDKNPPQIPPMVLAREYEPGMLSGHAGNSESKSKPFKSCVDQTRENTYEVPTMKMAQQNMVSGESSVVENLAQGSRKSMELNSKASETRDSLPRRTIVDRMIRYTYQRKRKRGSLTGPDGNESLEENMYEENVSADKSLFEKKVSFVKYNSHENACLGRNIPDETNDPENILSRNVAEEDKFSIEFPKSCSIMESPQDHLGLLQVAHQLISLSEKAW